MSRPSGFLHAFAMAILAATIFARADVATAARPTRVRSLGDESFEHDTQAATGQTTGRWLVLFATSDCLASSSTSAPAGPSCHVILDALKAAASAHDEQPGRLFVPAQVDVDVNPKLRKRFDVGSEPVVKLFRDRSMFTFPLLAADTSASGSADGDVAQEEEFEGGDLATRLRAFVKTGFKTADAEKVPPEASAGLEDLLATAYSYYHQVMRYLAQHPVWLASLGGLIAVGSYSITRHLLGLSKPVPRRHPVPRSRKAD